MVFILKSGIDIPGRKASRRKPDAYLGRRTVHISRQCRLLSHFSGFWILKICASIMGLNAFVGASQDGKHQITQQTSQNQTALLLTQTQETEVLNE